MTKRKNEFGIKCLLMYPAFQIVDPVTQAPLQLKAAVEFFPGAFLPEFVEVQNSIRQQLERQKMSLDAAANALIDLFSEYAPNGVKAKVEVINNNTFFPVAVIVESGDFEDYGGSSEGKKKQVKRSSTKSTGKRDDLGNKEGVDDDEEIEVDD